MFLQPIQRSTKTWLLLGVCLLVLSSMPVRSIFAAVTISQSVDNSLTEFTRGRFQRTSLGLLQDTPSSPKLPDKPGAVQLGPIGILKNWKGETSSEMPRKLFRMGATAIGSRIYVVGGQTPTVSGSETIANVISAPVNPTDGNILVPETDPPQSAWREEPALPEVIGSVQPDFKIPTAPINSAAVTSYAKPGGGGYIYVIGGNARIGTKDFSSYVVRVATVDSSGNITGWRVLDGAQIPDKDGAVDTIFQHGLQSSSAIMFTTGGKTFVYLVGGLQRYFEGSGPTAKTVSQGSASVFYAQVNTSNGGLYKPSAPSTEGWDQLTDIPVSRETDRTDAGMWDSTAFADRYEITDPDNEDTNALYVMGGQIAPDTGGSTPAIYTAATYVGLIQDDGTLFWSDWSGALPAARFGHSGVTYRGNLYVTGGIPSSGSNNEPDKQMLASYVEDSLQLPSFGTSNFLENEVLPVPRAFHATVLVQAGSGSQNNAYVYVIGGRGDTTDGQPNDDFGSESVLFSSIGGDEDKTYGYPTNGWYYSSVFPINFANAELREINWATQMIDPAMDIELDYRISTANSCDAPGFSDEPGTPTGWKLLSSTEAAGKRSADKINTFPIENLPARCFQYRARLISPSAGNAQAAAETPSLLNVAIEIIIPGSPDLKVDTLKVVPGATNPAAFGGLDAIITNKNAVEDTVAANAEKSGSFFVDLLVFEPGETVNVPTLPLSGADMARSRAYANVARDKLTPDARFRITSWCDQAAESGCVPFDQAKLITKVGQYTFVIVVDSTGCVDKDATSGLDYVCVRETSKQNGQNVGETNNTLAVTYDAPPNPANPSEPLPPEIVVLPPIDETPGAGCTGGQPFCLSLPLITK